MALVDEVGWNAAAVLQRIHWRCQVGQEGSWRATHADIAAEVRLSQRVVERATKELRDRGWLACGRAAAYDATPVWQIPGSVGVDSANMAGSDPAKMAVTPSSKKVRNNTSADAPETAFDAFWEVYPRKIGKGAARGKYDKALEKATAAVIHLGAQRYRAWVEASGTEFVKHPATWLNQECWADDLPAIPRSRRKSSAPDCWR